MHFSVSHVLGKICSNPNSFLCTSQKLQGNLLLKDVLYIWIKPADTCDWELTPNITSETEKKRTNSRIFQYSTLIFISINRSSTPRSHGLVAVLPWVPPRSLNAPEARRAPATPPLSLLSPSGKPEVFGTYQQRVHQKFWRILFFLEDLLALSTLQHFVKIFFCCVLAQVFWQSWKTKPALCFLKVDLN